MSKIKSTVATLPRSLPETPSLGDLVAIAFDEAMRITTDPTRAANLATAAVKRILVAGGDLRLVERLAGTS